MTKIKSYLSCIDTIRPVRDTLDIISGKWKLPIIISVSIGNNRFTDIQDSIPGITPKVLSKELKELEQNKLIKRIITEDYPVKITYEATEHAATLNPIIYALKDWGLLHRSQLFSEDKN